MSKKPRIVLTIGVFDGVHRGHQALLQAAVRMARRLKAEPWALTFQDHPAHVLRKGEQIPYLLSRSETFRLLKANGIQVVHVLRFTKAFSKKDPAQFLLWLEGLGDLKGILVGEGFRFGRGARGDLSDLREAGKRSGFKVQGLKPVRLKGRVISSSSVRELLRKGKVEQANRYLGRAYSIQGEVVHGRHVGHKIGFPTANLRGIRQFLPRDGVYACAVKAGGKVHRAGMNLGQRPTFRDDDHHRAAEVHLLDYRGRLYGKVMKVYLLKFLRPEKKFPSTRALAGQIRRDLAQVRKVPLRGFRA